MRASSLSKIEFALNFVVKTISILRERWGYYFSECPFLRRG